MTEQELGGFIATVEHPTVREEFRSNLRRALIATAASEWSTSAAPAPVRRPWLALPTAGPRYALAAAVVVLAAFSAGGVAAASSLPGDPAYSLKQAYEQVELALAGDPADEVRVLTVQSDRRLHELDQVTESHPERTAEAAAAYQATLAKLQAALSQLQPRQTGVSGERDEEAASEAETTAEKHIAALEAIKEQANTPAVEKAIQQAKDVEKKAKDKKHQGDDRDENKDDERKGDDKPGSGAVPAQRTNPTPAPRVTPRPTEKPDEHGG